MNCIFCKIANDEIPSRTLYEDAFFRVIMDLAPATKGHSLILLKEHKKKFMRLPMGNAYWQFFHEKFHA